MRETLITADNPIWNSTYPFITEPRAGESLAGFMLRLDELNGFTAGTTLRKIRKGRPGPAIVGTPSAMLSGGSLDLRRLAMLAGGIPLQTVESLTATALYNWVRCRGKPHGKKIGQARHFQICALCIRYRRLPITSLFADITGCNEHAIRFVSRCTCGTTIAPFCSQVPFTCHQPACGRAFEDLSAEPLTDEESADVAAWSAIYEDLLRISALGGVHVSSRQLAQAVRVLFARTTLSALSVLRPGYGAVSLAVLTRALYLTGSSAADLIAAIAASQEIVKGNESTDVCPNPSCRSRVVRHSGSISGRPCFLCADCGTRFTRARILFSFDFQAGYPAWRTVENRAELASLKQRIQTVAYISARKGQPLQRGRVLRLAGVPSSPAYLTRKAELAHVFEQVMPVGRRARPVLVRV